MAKKESTVNQKGKYREYNEHPDDEVTELPEKPLVDYIGAGRPPVFSSPEKLIQKTNEYFNNGMKKRTIVIGKGENAQTIDVELPTISGLAFYLGFESRQSFYDYEKREEFSYIVKRARFSIEQYYEEQTQAGNVTGAIFVLKNMGWIDQVTNLNMNHEIKPLTDEEKKEAEEEFKNFDK